MHEGGGRWVGSNKVVELKKKKKDFDTNFDVCVCVFLTPPNKVSYN